MSQAQVPRVAADYFRRHPLGSGTHPIITHLFHPGRGWVSQLGWRKRISGAWARKLRTQGVTHVALSNGIVRAEFTTKDLTSRKKGTS